MFNWMTLSARSECFETMSTISNVLFFVYLGSVFELARLVDVDKDWLPLPKVAVEIIYTVMIVFWPIVIPVGYLMGWHDDDEWRRPS
jgi:NhaP-type Na+/H+ or K+/H+ antiporter